MKQWQIRSYRGIMITLWRVHDTFCSSGGSLCSRVIRSFYATVVVCKQYGSSTSSILRLSDGGHIENFGILPLLKKRLRKIVVADGGHKSEVGDWAKDLLKVFSLAREKLHCSSIGVDGRDVIEDVKEKFVNTPRRHQPRSYRSVAFEVLFFGFYLLI